ncbi:MAG: MerR family DNA-binding transcriptional regulator [Firmicutes bacterium]|nr:MerR family DNA-binding transcriptional regulator [Bacillota bacterium]
MENKITYYTAEKFAKRAGVTSRTLRYYDKIGCMGYLQQRP